MLMPQPFPPFVGAIGGPSIMFGTNYDDALYGDWNWLNKNDEIYAGNGDDTVYAGSGNDYVNGGNGNDSLYGGFGDDSLFGGADDDRLFGDDGDDVVDGGKGADLLFGGRGNDIIIGGEGDDTLYGGSNSSSSDPAINTLTGGGGIDTFEFAFYGYSIDTITDFAVGKDKVDFSDNRAIDFDDVMSHASQVGDDVVIKKTAYTGLSTMVLEDVQLEDLSANDFIF